MKQSFLKFIHFCSLPCAQKHLFYSILLEQNPKTFLVHFASDVHLISKQILSLHPALAPFKVGIVQDGTKLRQIHEVAIFISRELRKAGLQILDTKETGRGAEKQIIRYW